MMAQVEYIVDYWTIWPSAFAHRSASSFQRWNRCGAIPRCPEASEAFPL